MAKKVPYVDVNGRVIMKLAEWKKKNPSAIYFDSPFEWRGYQALTKAGIDFIYQPESIVIIEPFTTLNFNKNKIEPVKVRGMVYTPDFYIKETGLYLELKGYFHEKDKNRFKLCQHILNKQQQSILLIMNDKELHQAIALIQSNYLGKKSNKINI